MADFTTFADPDDFCRAPGCKGGFVEETGPDGRRLSSRCDQCGGHGKKTIRVMEQDA